MDRTAEQAAIRAQIETRVAEMVTEGHQDKFWHGHGHTTHSVRDGLSKPKELMKTAKDLGMNAIAVTDHGVANGWVECAKAAKEEGIKFIPGVEIYLTEDRTVHSVNEMKDNGYRTYHQVIWPLTKEGYYNLVKIISNAGTEGKFDGKNRTDLNFIRESGLGRGLRSTSACLGGKLAKLALAGDIDGAVAFALECRDIFDEFYLEIQDNGIPEQEILNQLIIDELAPRTGCPIILNRDYHYVKKEHGDFHDTLKAIAYRNQKEDPCRGSGRYASLDAFYLSGPQEMWDYVNEKGLPPEAIYNGLEIAEAAEATVEFGKSFFPKFPKLPTGYTEKTYLKKMAHDGLLEYFQWAQLNGKFLDVNEYMDRLNYELGVISMKGYDGYFLIIWDIIKWCWSQGIMTGPGRGSAAGSLLSFTLKITRLDPIRRGLQFERFLNPFRESWPDIDFDIPSRHRPKVMQYVLDTYGEKNVSQIITYTKMGLRSGARDIIKALMNENDPNCIYTEDLLSRVSKLIPDKMPDQGHVTLKRVTQIASDPTKFIQEWGKKKAERVIKQCQEFMDFMHQYPYIHEHLQVLEGTIMATSLHAGGVVISPVPVADFIPVEYSKSDTAVLPVACFDGPMLEEAGFMKMDFLGLATLDLVDLTFEMSEKVTTKPRPDIYEIGREDPAVFKMITDGDTRGVFQISGGGLTDYLKKAKPHDMDGWCDVIALYRPGPLDAKVDKYTTIAERYVENGSIDPTVYMRQIEPALRPILQRTRGVTVYQEQIMAICQALAGYSLGDADTFRRIIGKKKVAEVKAMRYQFLYGGEGGLKLAKEQLNACEQELNDKGIPLEASKGVEPNDFQKRYAELKDTHYTLKKNKNHSQGGIALGFELDFLNEIYDQMVAFAG